MTLSLLPWGLVAWVGSRWALLPGYRVILVESAHLTPDPPLPGEALLTGAPPAGKGVSSQSPGAGKAGLTRSLPLFARRGRRESARSRKAHLKGRRRRGPELAMLNE